MPDFAKDKNQDVKNQKAADKYKNLFLTQAQKTRATNIMNDMAQIKAGDQGLNFSFPDKDGKVVKFSDLKGKVVLIDVWATWCGPCLMQAPILEQLSEEISEDELKIVKIDVDENPETAQKFGIMSIPTLLFKKDGEVVKQVAGVHTKEQIKAIVAELS